MKFMTFQKFSDLSFFSVCASIGELRQDENGARGEKVHIGSKYSPMTEGGTSARAKKYNERKKGES